MSSTTPSSSSPSGAPKPPSAFVLDPAIFNKDLYTSILSLWFPSYPEVKRGYEQAHLERWFMNADPGLDGACRTLASAALAALGPLNLALPPLPESAEEERTVQGPVLAGIFAGEFADAARVPDARDRAEAALALVLLLDQLTRNSLRADDAEQTLVYAHYDRLARAVVRAVTTGPGVAPGSADGLHLDTTAPLLADHPSWRLFLYMPLMHSEDLADHDAFAAGARDMLRRARELGDRDGARLVSDITLPLAKQHSDPIRRFGRYPWRNRYMGREHTEEEREYFEKGGATFGVKV